MVKTNLRVVCALLALPAAGLAMAEAPQAPVTAAQETFFEVNVRPLLVARCYPCHGPDVQQGGLRLDSREAILRGGGSGPAISLTAPESSHILQAISWTGKLKMPPAGKLKTAELAALSTWIKMGAPWPGKQPVTAAAPAGYTISPAQRAFWSFRPVRKPAPPKVKTQNRALNAIDRFILAKLEPKGLHLAPQADRRTLLRRVSLDLTGLPPTPEETAAFLADRSPRAYEKQLDRLLASPRYGERWARHWMDISRYSDTRGYVFNEDREYHYAYTYRDYLVRAFNADMPYNQFLKEQLAADLMPGADRTRLAALGFLTLGRRFLNDPTLIADDRIDTTCRGMMGLTVACARCHDHKFDPIPTRDYYSLYGVFASASDAAPVISPPAVEATYAAWSARMDAAKAVESKVIQAEYQRLKGVASVPADLRKAISDLKPGEKLSEEMAGKLEPLFSAAAKQQLIPARAAIEAVKKTEPPVPEHAPGLAENASPYDPHIFKRGNPNNPLAAVPRQFLEILSGPDRKPFSHGSGRLELAEDIASPANPLTPRVLVNRVWALHFGEGLVRTPSDFGLRGERPTHPELLDWLSSTFMEQGWSIKRLHRLILMSAAYQQSAAPDARGEALDPENRLLWRQNRQRLDLETLRDSLLAVSGSLDTTAGGPSVDILSKPFTHRRTVYAYIERQNLPGIFRTFDFASPDTTSARRYHTVVPQQALYLMNSEFVEDRARDLARRPDVAAAAGAPGKVRALYRDLFARAPDDRELALGKAFLNGPPPAPPVWQYGYGQYDSAHGIVRGFTPFKHLIGGQWQGGKEMPDPLLQYVSLSAGGGHPGSDANHAAIRRWVSPVDGAVTVAGTLDHPESRGDGVECWVVSSGSGELGHWTAFHGSAKTAVVRTSVHRGDILDFVTGCRSNPGYDSFRWTVSITAVPSPGVHTARLDAGTQWNSEQDFAASEEQAGPQFDLVARYAQALLMTNEFSFAD